MSQRMDAIFVNGVLTLAVACGAVGKAEIADFFRSRATAAPLEGE